VTPTFQSERLSARARRTSASATAIRASCARRAKRIDPGPQPDRIDIEYRRVARRLRVGVAGIAREPGPRLRHHRSHLGAAIGDGGAELVGLERLARARAARRQACGHGLLQVVETGIEQVELPEPAFAIIEIDPCERGLEPHVAAFDQLARLGDTDIGRGARGVHGAWRDWGRPG
jgi:hypothetical protein